MLFFSSRYLLIWLLITQHPLVHPVLLVHVCPNTAIGTIIESNAIVNMDLDNILFCSKLYYGLINIWFFQFNFFLFRKTLSEEIFNLFIEIDKRCRLIGVEFSPNEFMWLYRNK